MNEFDFDGNRHGLWVERNPDGTLKHQGRYVHGVFYTGKGYEKKQDPVRHLIVQALQNLSELPVASAQCKGRLKHAKQSLALLYRSIKQNKR